MNLHSICIVNFTAHNPTALLNRIYFYSILAWNLEFYYLKFFKKSSENNNYNYFQAIMRLFLVINNHILLIKFKNNLFKNINF